MTLSLDTVITRETLREVGACWTLRKEEEFAARYGDSMTLGTVLSCDAVTHADRVWLGCQMLARHRGQWSAFAAALEFARRAAQYAPESRRAELHALLEEVATLRGASRERCAEVRDRCWSYYITTADDAYAAYAAANAASASASDAHAAYAADAGRAAYDAAADAAAAAEDAYVDERRAQIEILRRMIGGGP